MFKERNQGSTQTNDLVWRYVHVLHFAFIKNREVTCLAAYDFIFSKVSFIIKRRIRLCDFGEIFFFCTEESQLLHFHFTMTNLTVWCFDKAHLIDLRVNAKCRDQTNVWTFRSFNCTKTSVVRIVYVTNLEACSFTTQTAWPER